MAKLTDEEILTKVKEFRQECGIGNADLFNRMIKAEDFKNGNQWEPSVRAYRERKGKFVLTIPLIKPQINQVIGSQINNPKDVVIVPEKSGVETVARIRSKLVKHALDSEHSVYEETQWFDSGLSSGIGFIGAFIDRHEDPKHGNLTIERLNEFECSLDPHCISYDINSYMNGAKYFIWEPWVDKDLIHEQYPDKKQAIEGLGQASTALGDATGFLSWLWGGVREMTSAIGRFITGYHPDIGKNIEKYKYKITHTWWRMPKKCVILYKIDQSEVQAVTYLKDSFIKEAKKLAKEMPDVFEVEEVIQNVIYHTITIGNVLLENIEDELNGVTKFPIGVFSAYFSNGYRSGMVEDMIGTQEEINWGHSQNLQVIKHLSTYHWKIGRDDSGKSEEWLRQNADEDNLIINESNFGGKVEKSISRPYLSGLDRFVEIAKENLKLISNVRTEEPAFDDKNMSGRAIALKQISSQTGQANVFQNFDYSMNLFGQLIDEIIIANEIYSPDEIRAICSDDELLDLQLMAQARDEVMSQFEQTGIEIPEPPRIQGQAEPQQDAFIQKQIIAYEKFRKAVDSIARPIAEDMLMDRIKNLRMGRYTTKVALSSYAPTMRMAEREEYKALNQELLASGYPPLSRKWLIQASDVPHKEEILQEDQMLQMAGQAVGAK